MPRQKKDPFANTVTLQAVEAFRTVYALNDISPVTKRLKATHYACVLRYGSAPIWGIFSAQSGRIVAFFGSRAEIEKAYPKKPWRVKSGGWTLKRIIERLDSEQAGTHLRNQSGAIPLPKEWATRKKAA